MSVSIMESLLIEEGGYVNHKDFNSPTKLKTVNCEYLCSCKS